MNIVFDELASKEVVNLGDGRRLGSIVDLEICLEDGTISNIIVPGPSKMFGFVRSERDYTIPWSRIVKIGDDVILVDMGLTPVE